MEEPEELKHPLSKKKDLFDANSLHELLYDHQSQDFKKSRRNLMVITFIVISVWFLGLDLTKLNVFGLKLENISSPIKIHFVGIILIGYWWAMFEFYRIRDKEIQVRRQDIVYKNIAEIKKELPKLEAKYQELVAYSPVKETERDKWELKGNLYYEIQGRRDAINLVNRLNDQNKPALNWALRVEKIELAIPRLFAILSLLLLIRWLF